MVYAENKVKNIFGFYKNRFIFAEVKNKETMLKYIEVSNCLSCPHYSEENNVYRHGTTGYLSLCGALSQEIEFTDKADTPSVYERVAKKCPL